MQIKGKNFAVVLEGIKNLDEFILVAGERGMRRGLQGAMQVSQKEYMSGPRPQKLGVRSTRLRQALTFDVKREGNNVRGRMGNNVVYAAFHEFGFRGTQNVKSFTRVIKSLDELGRDLGETRRRFGVSGENFFKESRKRAGSRQTKGVMVFQSVRAHKRNVNYKGRPFVRPALERMAPVILQEIQKEISTGKGNA